MKEEVKELYKQLIDAWNNRDARGMAELFSDNGLQIGFDGSKAEGNREIYAHLKPIFEDHPTAPFVTKVKSIRLLGKEVAILHAIAGMIPHGKIAIHPDLNAQQTLVARKINGTWQIELFQNTPAQFHGRSELVDQMTEELNQVIQEWMILSKIKPKSLK